MKKYILLFALIGVIVLLFVSWQPGSSDTDKLAEKIATSGSYKKWQQAINAYDKERRVSFYTNGHWKKKRFTSIDLDRIRNNESLTQKQRQDSIDKMLSPKTPGDDKRWEKSMQLLQEFYKEFPELRTLSRNICSEVLLTANKLYDKKRKATYATYYDN